MRKSEECFQVKLSLLQSECLGTERLNDLCVFWWRDTQNGLPLKTFWSDFSFFFNLWVGSILSSLVSTHILSVYPNCVNSSQRKLRVQHVCKKKTKKNSSYEALSYHVYRQKCLHGHTPGEKPVLVKQWCQIRSDWGTEGWMKAGFNLHLNCSLHSSQTSFACTAECSTLFFFKNHALRLHRHLKAEESMRCSLEESLTSGFSLQPFGSAKTLLPLDVVSEHAVQMSLFEKHCGLQQYVQH